MYTYPVSGRHIERKANVIAATLRVDLEYSYQFQINSQGSSTAVEQHDARSFGEVRWSFLTDTYEH